MRRCLIPGILLLLTACATSNLPPAAQPGAASTPTELAAARPTRLASPTLPQATSTPAPPTALPTATHTPEPTALPTATPSPTLIPTSTPAQINGITYDAYIPAARKRSQAFKYTCEFDAAWVILQTYGFGVTVPELIDLMPIDTSIEPHFVETAAGFEIYGGDIINAYSGNYTNNFLARSTGPAIAQIFTHYQLEVTPVSDRAGVEAALRRGALIWMKTTVDFKEWRSAVWIMPDGQRYKTVLGNDHAVVVMGFNEAGVVIRDVLGPTSSNWERPYEYSVDWTTFMNVWAAQSLDGLAVSPPK